MNNPVTSTVITLVLAATSLSAATLYVSVGSPNPTPPYTNWQTAARVIQDAVDAATAEDEVVVADGVYSTGGRPVGTNALVNRVAMDKPITVRSVSGPGATIIQGYQPAGQRYGNGAARCAYLTAGTLLDGFTLTGGATLGWGFGNDSNTGGVWSEPGGVVSNCIIADNGGYSGGGASGGTLLQCTVMRDELGVQNAALIGCTICSNFSGGAVHCTLTNCTLAGNSLNQPGGAAHDSTLVNCLLTGNSAYQGGAVADSVLYGCILRGNSGGEGGAAWDSTLNNCILAGNTASWRGGGAFGGTLNGCALTDNSASSEGGGACWSTLNNCTLTGNSVGAANGAGGGAFDCALYNCILYFNTASAGANYDASSGLMDCCTTPLPAGGSGNIGFDPQLATASRLSANSPCRGAGSAAYATGTDIDGEPWESPPSIGCDEYHAGAVTGPLTVGLVLSDTNVAVGYAVGLTAWIEGRATLSVWDFGDGGSVSNRPYAAHAWAAPGDYTVMLRAYNDSLPGGVAATGTVHVAAALTHYVAVACTNPQPPYTSWATAAVRIQDAVDAALTGDVVMVTNGIYATGGRALGTNVLMNRVAVDRAVMLRSVNGPQFTVIQGQAASTRCVYLTNGASLSGFTLTQGGTRRNAGDSAREQSGGGLWCESTSAVVSNCVITGNSACYYGGGAYGGTLNNCTLTGNSAASGGAAYSSSLNNCWVWGNTATSGGGGAFGGTLNGCALAANSAVSCGGGAYSAALNNCTLTGNSTSAASSSGGGAYGCSLVDCVIYFNTAPSGANYDSSSGLNYCCVTPLPAVGTRNISLDPQLASPTHLSSSSPCRGAGSAAFTAGSDIDGEAWANPPSIGCDEYHAGAVTGLLSVAILAPYTNVNVGYRLGLTALIDGRTVASVWDFGDGSFVSNWPCATHAWSAVGDYTVALRAYNESYPQGVTGSLTVHVASAVYYVSAANPNPVAPYTNWATAAQTIQDAVDAAVIPGAVVLVNSGVYSSGGRAVGTNTLVNRVAVTRPVAVRSLNGPQSTTIVGYQVPGTTNGSTAIRCVYLADGAALSGFTLSRGGTLANGDSYLNVSGGGVCCDSTNAMITNCVLSYNSAYSNGGGACGGTLNHCTLARNWTPLFGGAAFGSTLNGCTVSGNWADSGGGVKYGLLNNCVLVGNTAGGMDGFGGGARAATLNNCTVAGNSAWMGGGASGIGEGGCWLNNCIICNNYAQYIYHSDVNTDGFCSLTYCWTGDPVFVSYPSDLHLEPNSPCINAGNNAYVTTTNDLDGNPRIVSGAVDIGAYEYQGTGSVISYAWLQQHGLATDGSADYADSDHDGLNNWQEWVCGTNPTNALSALRMVAALPTSTNTTVAWQSVAGVNYFLERSGNLASPFTLLATNIAGQASTTTYADTNAIGAGPFFYRVGVRAW